MGKVTWHTCKNGITKGLYTTWNLAKIIFPITFVISILKYTPVIPALSSFLEPLMHFFGLTGDSALVLVLGNFLNLYAAVGAILTMDLTIKQVFILAVMLSLSHNMLVETAVITRIGVKPWISAGIRLVMAFAAAKIIDVFWQGGQTMAQYGLVPSPSGILTSWTEIVINAFQTALIGIAQVAVMVTLVMIMIQILKDIHILDIFSRLLRPFTNFLGLSESSAVTLLAGTIFGIAYGAGVIIQSAEEENLSKKDIYLISIFLCACHAVIEDTLIFVPLGINVLPLLILRLILALFVTTLSALIWRRLEGKTEGEQINRNQNKKQKRRKVKYNDV
ncbi:nucleoside recognition domain-containing protein [Dehalobacter sp. DCM]|uniref:nucleoside recognition domain-containing protein n=1 Tax=Dehalobacter sp. DCM TaxID=2907827 RepID=UPI0030821682|nr:nucleoside recognition domain-containing protein [Dehalobacter sp. DCM]